MPPAALSPDAAAAARRSDFVRARLASALAVIPLGAWTTVHVAQNLYAFSGARAWENAVTDHASPITEALTAILVLLPLALHTAWGVGRLVASRPNNLGHRGYSNLKYLLQRASAVGLLLFVGAHLWLAYLKPRLLGGGPEPFADIAHEMHFHRPTLVVYLLGTLAVAFHLANGMQTFCMGWGIVATRAALRRLEAWIIALFVVLLLMSWGAVYALWEAGANTPT